MHMPRVKQGATPSFPQKAWSHLVTLEFLFPKYKKATRCFGILNVSREWLVATRMAGIQGLFEPLQQEVSPSPLRRPRFPKQLLLEKEKFVDPASEAAIILPQQQVASTPIVLELEKQQEQQLRNITQKRNAIASSIYMLLDFFAAFFAKLKKRLKGRRARAKLTREGQDALEQLRYLAALCDATSCRTPEEILEAEAAFGEAYYEIMNLSANLEKMSEREQSHHLRRYSRHMGRLLTLSE